MMRGRCVDDEENEKQVRALGLLPQSLAPSGEEGCARP